MATSAIAWAASGKRTADQRRSSAIPTASTPGSTIAEAITRPDNGVMCHGHTAASSCGIRNNSVANATTPRPTAPAIRTTAFGATAS
jgi:hypothetical protein